MVFFNGIFRPDKATGVPGDYVDFTSTFFVGLTGLVWCLVFLQAIRGMLVALVIRYCNKIVKSFSTAFAIVVIGTASVYLLNTPLNGTFVFGSCVMMIPITVYSLVK
ncbi:hypothetical protein JKF63_01558 [Porcisia hertigi]|uniref:Uncharacterized protein n=1 Tax=Porcisia hertigi TaxID=2761500 RepID=A0A836HUZ4_9TRYP|nr:hypothetical protein JKF63_01558 [Porcisia hertigi]